MGEVKKCWLYISTTAQLQTDIEQANETREEILLLLSGAQDICNIRKSNLSKLKTIQHNYNV